MVKIVNKNKMHAGLQISIYVNYTCMYFVGLAYN